MKQDFGLLNVEKALLQIYDSLKLSMGVICRPNTKLESFVKRYKYFRYYGTHFVFKKDLSHDALGEKFLNIGYVIDENNNIKQKPRPVEDYMEIFPFMVFGQDFFQDNWMTPWYKSKTLLDMFPTRKNIIRDILKDLKNDC